MSKSTRAEADETTKIQVSIIEWDNMFNASEKTFINYHNLLHKRLFEQLNGCCPFNFKQKHVRKGTQRSRGSPLVNLTAKCPISSCKREFAFLVYDNEIESSQVNFLVKMWGEINHSSNEQKKRKIRGINVIHIKKQFKKGLY